MKKISFVVVLVVIGMLCPGVLQAETYKKWKDVRDSWKTVKVYVEKIANATSNPKISEERSTDVVKKMFKGRITPKFEVVGSKGEADIVFEGAVKEYIWMEKAPITDVYGAGALAVDLATRGGKNYARKIIEYSICDAGTDKELIEGETLVTLKRPGMPEEQSYEMMYARAGKMLAKDIFRKGKRNSLRP